MASLWIALLASCFLAAAGEPWFSNIPAATCPFIQDDNNRNLPFVDKNCGGSVEATTCHMDHDFGPTGGFPVIITGSVKVSKTNTTHQNDDVERSLTGAQYDNDIMINTRGCYGAVMPTLYKHDHDFSKRFMNHLDYDRLQKIFPKADTDAVFKLKRHLNKDISQIPATTPWYSCKSDRWHTQWVRDPKTQTRYIYQVDLRVCACNRPNCQQGAIPDAVEAFFAPLGCYSFCTDRTFNSRVMSTTIDGRYGAACKGFMPHGVLAESVCRRNTTMCTTLTIDIKENDHMNRVYVGGCYEKELMMSARQLGLNEMAYHIANGDKKFTIDSSAVSSQSCTVAFCNNIPMDAPKKKKKMP